MIKYTKRKKIDSIIINKIKEKSKILCLGYEFITLKTKKITRQEWRFHQFGLTKREIAKLLTIKNSWVQLI